MKLKNFCVNLILLIQILLIYMLGFEIDNTDIFIKSKIIIVLIIIINHLILKKYTDLFD